MKKQILLPGLALGGGVLGFGLRRWQLSSAYLPEEERFLHGAPATLALLGVLALAVLILALLLRKGRSFDDFLPAFRCPVPAFMGTMAAAGLLFFGAGVLGLLESMKQLALWRMYPASVPLAQPLLLALCSVLCFPAGLAVLALGRAAYREQMSRAALLLASAPGFAGLCWLLSTHLAHGVDPILMHFGFQLAAAIVLTLALYFAICPLFGKPHPRAFLFCALFGPVLAMTALADLPSPATLLRLAAFSLAALALAAALLRNAHGQERMPLGADRLNWESAPEQDTEAGQDTETE